MKMIQEIYEVVRLLMTLVHGDGKQRRPSANRKHGGLLVLLSTESHPSEKLTCTIAAAGPWCPETSIESVSHEVTASLPVSASICTSPDTEELFMFTESAGPLNFLLAFQVSQANQCWQEEMFSTEAFLHRISLVHAQLTFFYQFKDNGKTHQQIFGDDVNSKLLLNHRSIIMDSTCYQLCPFSVGGLAPCGQMHAVVGAKVPLPLPPQLVETGLCGELSIVSMAALAPCMDQYPNWPVRLTTIQVLVYSPCGMPYLEANMAAPLSFLQVLAGSLVWKEMGLTMVTCADKLLGAVEATESKGLLCCDMVFHVEDKERNQETESKWNHTVMQTLTLFLFLHHSDPFHSQLSDIIANEALFEKHLDQVLWHNSKRVTSSLQSLLEKTLKPYQKKCLNQEKMQSALSVILSSLTSVVNSSSSVEFRTACLDNMKVQDTHQLSTSLERSLHNITGSRLHPLHRCGPKKPEIGGGHGSAVQRTEEQEETCVREVRETDDHADLVSCAAKRQGTPLSAGESPSYKQRPTEVSELQENLLSSSPVSQSQLCVRNMPSVTLATNISNQIQQEDTQWLEEIQDFSEWD